MTEISPAAQPTPPSLRRPARRKYALAATAVVLAAACVALTLLLLDGVRENGDLSRYDPAITDGAVASRSLPVTVLAQVVTFYGSTICLVTLTLALVLWLGVRRKQWTTALAVAAVMIGATVVTTLVKSWVSRVRPPTGLELGTVANDPSFPSGHTFNGTVFAALLVAALCAYAVHSRSRRTALVAGGLVLVFLVGLSRIYLGYHWLTDVLAGWLLATAYLCLVFLGFGGVAAIRDRRRTR